MEEENKKTYGLVTNTGFAQGDAVTEEVSGTLGISHQDGLFQKNIGVDLYNQSITGDVACSITESGQQVGGHSGAKVIQTGCDVFNLEFTGEVGAPLTTATGSCNGTGTKVICFRPGITSRLGRPMERTDVSGTIGRTTGDNTEHIMIYNSADTVRMRSGKEGGGKGALVSNGTSLTLATGNDQSVFCYDDQGGGVMYELNDGSAPTIRNQMRHHEPMVYGYDVTGCSISEQIMGTIAKNCGQSANRCGGGSVLEAIYALDGDKINKSERSGGNGMGWNDKNVAYTETSADRHAVAYSKVCRPKESDGCPTFKDTGVANTLNRFDCGGEVRANELAVFTVDADRSNSMKSANPNSGFHKSDVAKTLDTSLPTPAKAQGGQMVTVYDNHPNDSRVTEAESGAVQSITARAGTGGGNLPFVAKTGVVRRLTPLECERLMGFPGGYTQIPWKGKPAEECPDSPRYAACGNSMCVNVMRWIGIRIQNYDDKMKGTRDECDDKAD